jgi:nitrite reductase/ring-hydroxylating ferredoxin subunit
MGRGVTSNEGALVELCDMSEVHPDTPKRVDKLGLAFAVFQVGESYYVTQDTCTHGPGSLSEGYVENGEVECPFHQGRFCIATGKPTLAPCTVPLQVWAVTLRGGKVCITQGQKPASGAS